MVVWGLPGAAKSQIAQQVAVTTNRQYVDVPGSAARPRRSPRHPLARHRRPHPMGAARLSAPRPTIPAAGSSTSKSCPRLSPWCRRPCTSWCSTARWASTSFPRELRSLPAATVKRTAASSTACPPPLASRFVHVEIRVDAEDWLEWGAANGIVPEVLFFVTYEPDLLHRFDPQSRERAFPCPRTWEFVSNIVKHRNGLDPATERALFRGTVGEAAAVEFSAFLNVWRELPHPRAVLNDPGNADIPENASALMALCGSLYRLATDVTIDAIVTFAQRLRRELGESLAGACVRRDPALQRSPAFIRWAAARTQ